jgi:hypothetical protein
MKPPTLTDQYDKLSAKERFRLIMAAMERGDETDLMAITKAAQNGNMLLSDHSPYCMAFMDLAPLVYIDLVEEAAEYRESWERARFFHDDEEQKPQKQSSKRSATGKSKRPNRNDRSPSERALHLALAAGCRLREKANGWKQFCAKLAVPSDTTWERYPGYARLMASVNKAQKVAFTPNGYRRWLNGMRPVGAPKIETQPLTAKGIAREIEKNYLQLLRKWKGRD